MGWWHLPQLCPFGLDSAGDETSSKKGCCKVNVLPCFPEHLLKGGLPVSLNGWPLLKQLCLH